ncbi:MAG TPA: hypothetical protein VF649_08725 [Sphingomonas sp.]|jgi:predicted aspartyl protease|uniref:hypothetical protein n=1 Tax=Sphingomonas sp. TaxID=28214 RepID=UPI002ED89C5B
MTVDDGANILYLLLAIVLVGSALVVRWQPTGRIVRHGLIWVVIFATAALLSGLLFNR